MKDEQDEVQDWLESFEKMTPEQKKAYKEEVKDWENMPGPDLKDNPNKTFMAAVLAGEAKIDQVDDWVETWHQNGLGGELHQALGLSWQEYSDWVKNPNVLDELVEQHKK